MSIDSTNTIYFAKHKQRVLAEYLCGRLRVITKSILDFVRTDGCFTRFCDF